MLPLIDEYHIKIVIIGNQFADFVVLTQQFFLQFLLLIISKGINCHNLKFREGFFVSGGLCINIVILQWNTLRVKLGILDFDVKVSSIKNNLKSLILSNQICGESTEWNDQNHRLITY